MTEDEKQVDRLVVQVARRKAGTAPTRLGDKKILRDDLIQDLRVWVLENPKRVADQMAGGGAFLRVQLGSVCRRVFEERMIAAAELGQPELARGLAAAPTHWAYPLSTERGQPVLPRVMAFAASVTPDVDHVTFPPQTFLQILHTTRSVMDRNGAAAPLKTIAETLGGFVTGDSYNRRRVISNSRAQYLTSTVDYDGEDE